MHICVQTHPHTHRQTQECLAWEENWQMVEGLDLDSGWTFVNSWRWRNVVTSDVHGESVAWIWWDEITTKVKYNYRVKQYNYTGIHNMQRTESYRGGQHLPPVICLFTSSKTNESERERKHLSWSITGIVIRKCFWLKNNLNHFQSFNFAKPQRHLSYIFTVVIIKCRSCSLVYCQNLSFLDKWVMMNQRLLIQQQNNTSGKIRP